MVESLVNKKMNTLDHCTGTLSALASATRSSSCGGHRVTDGQWIDVLRVSAVG